MSYAAPKLPTARLSREVHLAAERSTWEELTTKLRADAPKEACAFVLTRPSRGKERTTVLLREIIWPRPGEVTATEETLEISADYISRALDAAIDAGPLVGLCLVHTHPKTKWGEGAGRFSGRDDWYENRLFPTVVQGRKEAISASLVLGSIGDLDARIWWSGTAGPLTQEAHAVRIVGPELSILETPSSTWKDHPDPEVMDRSTRLWGKEGRRRLQNLRVGVVGGGGTGGIVALALATMGVGSVLLWDKDIAKKQNRHRTIGITSDFIGQPKVRALESICNSVSTAEPFAMEVYEDWGTTAEALRHLKDCDVVFCCVDKLRSRVPLNDHAYAHLVPTFDVASWIHTDKEGRVDAMMTHAHTWSPGIPCGACRGILTPYELMREAQGRQRGIERKAAYGLEFDQTDGVEPSVMPLNMLGVSLALIEFMQVALRVTERTPNDLKFILPEWELDESDRKAAGACDCIMSIAMGEALTINPIIED
jgi:hypothetical protein